MYLTRQIRDLESRLAASHLSRSSRVEGGHHRSKQSEIGFMISLIGSPTSVATTRKIDNP
jgi:hypothetical protein